MAVERTLILIKPDAVQRGLAGEILGRIERRGLRDQRGAARHRRPRARRGALRRAPREAVLRRARRVHHLGADLALVVEGEGAIATLRATIGATDPANAAPGTIRGDLALAMPDNLVHGSDSPESAERELALWFGD